MSQTTNIASGLQRDAILNNALIALKAELLPFRAFSIRIEGVPLEGTDKIQVPYFPLVTEASKPFVPATGYEFTGTNTQQTKEVTVDQRPYQPLSYTSAERARQPKFDPETLGTLRGRKLAEDVLADVLGLVKADPYGAPAMDPLDPADFSVEGVVDLRKAAQKARWPKVMRAMCINADLEAAILKDTNIRFANQAGQSVSLTEGTMPRLLGFDYFTSELIPDNGQNLLGFICYPSAIAIAFSPIRPADDGKVIEYDTLTDPETNLTIEYRRWFDPTLDEVRETLECNYGRAVLEAAALKRIVGA